MQEIITYWQVLRKRWWLICILLATTVGAIVLAAYLSPPLYQASAWFQVIAPLPAEVSLYREFRETTSTQELVRTSDNFMNVLQSHYVAGQVIDRLGLDMGLDEFQRNVTVEEQEESSYIGLLTKAEDPELAAEIANTMLAVAVQYFGEVSAGAITANKEFIQELLRENEVQLAEAREALIQFQIENRSSYLDALLMDQQDLIASLKFNRDTAEAEGREAQVSTYGQLITGRERELQGLILLEAEYSILADEYSEIKAINETLRDKETEARLKENEIKSAWFIQVVPAPEPSDPLPRVRLVILLIGGVLSLALGFAIAFFLDYFESETAQSENR